MISVEKDLLYRYVRSRLAPQTDRADDVVQEVFLTALENFQAYRGEAPLESWLIGIANHKVKDYYRERQRAPEPFETVAEQAEAESFTPDFDKKIDTELARKKTRDVLRKLPQSYRDVLILRYWEEHSVRTIAQTAGKTEKAIERLLSRARDQFRLAWKQEH